MALVVDGELLLTDYWSRDERCKHASEPERIVDYFDWLVYWVGVHRPDMACIEFLSVERNAQTTRVVSHYQAASVIVCKRAGLVVIGGRATMARRIVIGRGNASKEETWEEIKRRYPTHDFGRRKPGKAVAVTAGGMDRTDSVVMALAGPAVAES